MKIQKQTEENIAEAEQLPPEDSTAGLYEERRMIRREGKLEDIAAVQAIICIIAAAALVVTNIRLPDRAEEIFHLIKGYSLSEEELFGNPIDTISELIAEICRK